MTLVDRNFLIIIIQRTVEVRLTLLYRSMQDRLVEMASHENLSSREINKILKSSICDFQRKYLNFRCAVDLIKRSALKEPKELAANHSQSKVLGRFSSRQIISQFLISKSNYSRKYGNQGLLRLLPTRDSRQLQDC